MCLTADISGIMTGRLPAGGLRCPQRPALFSLWAYSFCCREIVQSEPVTIRRDLPARPVAVLLWFAVLICGLKTTGILVTAVSSRSPGGCLRWGIPALLCPLRQILFFSRDFGHLQASALPVACCFHLFCLPDLLNRDASGDAGCGARAIVPSRRMRT